MNIAELIKNANLSDDEKSVINNLVQAIENNHIITIRELAKKTYCSSSKIVRIARSLGFFGYSDMVSTIRRYHNNSIKFKFSDAIGEINIDNESIKVVDSLIEDITSEKYKRIYCVGIDYSNYVCNFLCDKLVQLGYSAFAMNPTDSHFGDDRYLLLLVSNSGETGDLLTILNSCNKDPRCKTYVLTSMKNSVMSKKCENSIIMASNDNKNKKTTYFTGNSIILCEKISEIISNFKGL